MNSLSISDIRETKFISQRTTEKIQESRRVKKEMTSFELMSSLLKNF